MKKRTKSCFWSSLPTVTHQIFRSPSVPQFLTNTKDLWLLCKRHMGRTPTGTLHSHGFRIIMSHLLDTTRNKWVDIDYIIGKLSLYYRKLYTISKLIKLSNFSQKIKKTIFSHLKFFWNHTFDIFDNNIFLNQNHIMVITFSFSI